MYRENLPVSLLVWYNTIVEYCMVVVVVRTIFSSEIRQAPSKYQTPIVRHDSDQGSLGWALENLSNREFTSCIVRDQQFTSTEGPKLVALL